MRGFDWNDFRFALCLGRTGSYSTAARRLGVNESTAVRRVARLEAALRARLFERRRGRVVPTSAGAMFLAHAEDVERAALRASEALAARDRPMTGRVRITSVPWLVNQVLAPVLPGFLARFPDLAVTLIAESANLSLSDDEADIALRFARPKGEAQMRTRRIANIEFGIFAIAGASATDLPWITYRDQMFALPQARWLAEARLRRHEPVCGLRVDGVEAALSAVRAGCAKAWLPVCLGQGDADLARMEAPDGLRFREMWLMLQPHVRDLPRMRATADWLLAMLPARLSARGSTLAPGWGGRV